MMLILVHKSREYNGIGDDVKTTQIYTHVLNQNAWAIRCPADDM